MTLSSFEQSIINSQLAPDASVYLQSLWYDAKGDWHKAHSLVDNLSGTTAAAVHAYLHRVEGDTWNANYWYRRAERKMPDMSLADEWKSLVETLLNEECEMK